MLILPRSLFVFTSIAVALNAAAQEQNTPAVNSVEHLTVTGSAQPSLLMSPKKSVIDGPFGKDQNLTDIARSLSLSPHTIKTHIYNIFKKINASNRLQAVNWAQENL